MVDAKRMKKFVGALGVLLILYKVIFTVSGCAQIVPPTGGPRDSLPPVLVAAMPKDSTLNFKGKKIVLAFDEYIQVDRPQEEIIVSPTPKTPPRIEAKLKEVTVTIADTLEENTTYSINFGRSLKDLNEGNPYKNFTYLFSTGSYLDSGSLQGRVVIAHTGRPDSTLIVMLHRNLDDSAVAKESPRYYARLDSAGMFRFNNISNGEYHLFALKDQGGQRMYTRGSDLFAFYSEKIIVGDSNVLKPVLYAFAEEEESGLSRGGKTTGSTSRTTGKSTPKKEKKLTYTTSLEANQQDLLSDLRITFSDSLVEFDETKLHFTDTAFTAISGYSLEADSTGKLISFKYPWRENETFNLILEKEIASDSSGLQLAQSDTITFTTKKRSDYGALKARLVNLDTVQRVVLLFYKADKLDQAKPALSKEVNFELFNPGEYEIRVLYDSNGNGKWDTGNYWTKRQPEKIISFPKKHNIRPNWDNEITLELPALPPPDADK